MGKLMSKATNYNLSAMMWLYLACICLPSVAFGACRGYPQTPGMIIHYHGAIGNKVNVGMSLVIDGDALEGWYYYDKYMTDIKLSGHFIDDANFELSARDGSGAVIETFTGEFAEHAAGYRDKDLSCEIMTGTFQKKSDGQTFPFHLVEDSSVTGSKEAFYGSDGGEILEAKIQRYWRAVKADDKQVVASFYKYPFRIVTMKGTKLRISNEAEFVSHYSEIIPSETKNIIIAAVPHDMFHNWQGVMLGDGVVWFDYDGSVIHP